MDRRRRALALGILGARGDAPAIELSSPIAGAEVTTLYPEFSWQALDGATTYDIEVATDSAFTNIALTEAGVADTTWTADASLPSALYYWRVTSDNGGVSAIGTFNLSVFEFQVTTTEAAQTFTLQAMDVAVGEEIEITWGDGTTDNTYTATGVRSHVYATADTYDVRVGGAEHITGIDWRDGKMVVNMNVNVSKLSGLTDYVYLYYLPNLTWDVGSSAGAAFPAVTSYVTLHTLPNLTWDVGSSAGANMPAVTNYVYLYNLPNLTWADYGQIPNNVNTFTLYNSLDNTAMNAFINGMWGRRAAFLKATTWALHTTNVAPSGTYQAACPPTSAREQIYELINDSCGEGFVKQTAITVAA